MTIEEAKEQLTVSALWERLGLPGTPKKSCRSPFREDSSSSFSVYKDGRQWHDFATGEDGDAIDFLAQASGLELKDATTKFIEMAGGGYQPCPVARANPKPKRETLPRPLPELPELRDGTEKEYWQLCMLRGIGAGVLATAHQRGFLHFAEVKGHPSWVITDGTRKNAQARRLDGGTWRHIGNKKAYTLPGSHASWPIGAVESKPFPKVALVEGGPDLLAALQFAWAESVLKEVAPVAILGAGNLIPEDSLPLFARKRVRIYPHTDEAGRKGAQRWVSQLRSVGAEVDGFNFAGLRVAGGAPVTDLNELVNGDPDSLEGLEHPIMP